MRPGLEQGSRPRALRQSATRGRVASAAFRRIAKSGLVCPLLHFATALPILTAAPPQQMRSGISRNLLSTLSLEAWSKGARGALAEGCPAGVSPPASAELAAGGVRWAVGCRRSDFPDGGAQVRRR